MTLRSFGFSGRHSGALAYRSQHIVHIPWRIQKYKAQTGDLNDAFSGFQKAVNYSFTIFLHLTMFFTLYSAVPSNPSNALKFR